MCAYNIPWKGRERDFGPPTNKKKEAAQGVPFPIAVLRVSAFVFFHLCLVLLQRIPPLRSRCEKKAHQATRRLKPSSPSPPIQPTPHPHPSTHRPHRHTHTHTEMAHDNDSNNHAAAAAAGPAATPTPPTVEEGGEVSEIDWPPQGYESSVITLVKEEGKGGERGAVVVEDKVVLEYAGRRLTLRTILVRKWVGWVEGVDGRTPLALRHRHVLSFPQPTDPPTLNPPHSRRTSSPRSLTAPIGQVRPPFYPPPHTNLNPTHPPTRTHPNPIHPPTHPSTHLLNPGTMVWPVSLWTAEYIHHTYREHMKGKRVVELGCGWYVTHPPTHPPTHTTK